MSRNKDGSVNWIDLQCQTGVWYTPRKILDPTDQYFGGQIPYDPCTSPNNPTRAREFTTDIGGGDGLEMDWKAESRGDGFFINPPYGQKNNFRGWLAKMHWEVMHTLPGIALLPMVCP